MLVHKEASFHNVVRLDDTWVMLNFCLHRTQATNHCASISLTLAWMSGHSLSIASKCLHGCLALFAIFLFCNFYWSRAANTGTRNIVLLYRSLQYWCAIQRTGKNLNWLGQWTCDDEDWCIFMMISPDSTGFMQQDSVLFFWNLNPPSGYTRLPFAQR